MLIVFTTCPTTGEAEALAHGLVDQRLAACVQIMPKMTSIYFWDGAIGKEDEHLLLIKTSEDKFSELEAYICQNHSYDVPEIVAVESKAVSEKYREWLEGYLLG